MSLVEDIKLELEERLERANLSKEMLEDNKQETQVSVFNTPRNISHTLFKAEI